MAQKKKMAALTQVEKISAMLGSNKKKAEEMVSAPRKLLGTVRQTRTKLIGIRKGPILPLTQDFTIAMEMVSAYAGGTYKKVPVKSIIAVVAMFLYFINPFDVIPDAIPVVGYIDDVFVASKLIKLVEGDLKAFRKWQASS